MLTTDADIRSIPPALLRALITYINTGRMPGQFLTAVLHNNLLEAVARADVDSVRALPHLVAFLVMEVPEPAWGYPEKVEQWSKTGGSLGRGSHWQGETHWWAIAEKIAADPKCRLEGDMATTPVASAAGGGEVSSS